MLYRRVRMDVVGYFALGCVLLCGSDAAPVGNSTDYDTGTNSTDKDANGTDNGSKHYYHYNHYGNHYYGHHYGNDYGHNDYDHHGEDMFGHVETNLTTNPDHEHILNEYLNYGFSQHGHDNKTEGMLGKISKYLRNDAATTLTSTSMTLFCLTVGKMSLTF
ncbi:probable serine/threonine-protein kinase fhkB [Haliotis rufescens]|uniref:probable serine/threonine-protein kinase fhkB n=1 Tax=Haliotis rufescens TaxID=6454 RepID=UPI001EB0497A|nr:probable serine/threonine-protein kinase fhkB [Haliotis rufescens]